MCRCCQNCWEDFYWNCIEERFCYDETIANYNPEEDEEYIAAQKNGQLIGRITNSLDNNNLLTATQPICDQPMPKGNSGLFSAKIHEEDYRRETQTNVPMLGPEILDVFANSQIFKDHQPTKLNRINTKTYITGIHTPNKDLPQTPSLSDQERLIRRLEANLNSDATDNNKRPVAHADDVKSNETTVTSTVISTTANTEKRITFTLASDSSPEGSQTLTPKRFDSIVEEESNDSNNNNHNNNKKGSEVQFSDEVILRPNLIDHVSHLMPPKSMGTITPKRVLRSAKSVPHMNVRMYESETDIFSITGTRGSQISMTPEVPSISFSNLPKNYEDTPTIEKYRVSQSLYSIQTANAARASQDDYSMPRYFRRSAMITQSTEFLPGSSSMASASLASSSNTSRDELRQPSKEKNKRLQMLRSNLPPLLIHSVSFKRNRDEGKQLD